MTAPNSYSSIPKHYRSDIFAISGFLGLLIIFFPGLFFARQASLMGDHWEQHYPWVVLMAQSLKQGVWPFWTSLIQCGFPIAAESQMGLFYIPNLLLYTLLPLQWAYSYMNIVHFVIAGLGMYLYCRKIRLAPVGAFVAAVVFVFGTGYGGAYYNITSLKTLSWFPCILWAFEEFSSSFRKRYVLLTALFMSFSILAGYLQVATLMMLICAIYFLLRIFAFPEVRQGWILHFRSGWGMALAVLGAVILSLPQLLLTYELTLFSNRIDLTEAYTYVGSLSPLTLLTLVFPKLQGIFRGNCLYFGIFAIYFVCAAFFVARQDLRRILWLWVTVGLVSLFLALGEWSPLYVSLVKLTHFYSFRVPAKFLIFVCFSLAVLSGLGAHAWSEELAKVGSRLRALNRVYLRLVAGILGVWGVTYFFLTAGRPILSKIGNWLVVRFIFGKSGHPRSIESYFEAVGSAITTARDLLMVSNPWQLWAFVLVLTSCFWALMTQRVLARFTRTSLCLSIAIITLLVDLYVFAGEDIKKDFDSYRHVLKPNAIVQTLLTEKSAGRLGRIYGFHRENETLPLIPSVNMLYGIEDIGGYSPLIMRRYYETIGRLGNVNDSNSMQAPEVSYVLDRLLLLNAFDVSHVLSKRKLEAPDLQLLLHDLSSATYLYRNRGSHKRAFFISEGVQFLDGSRLKEMLMSPGFDPQKVLLLEHSEKENLSGGFRLDAASKALKSVRENHAANSERWTMETTGPGFFVLSNTMYPGWEAQLDGQKVPILTAYGLFQAVYIPAAGEHSVEFSYSPFHGLRRIFHSGEDKTHAK